MKNWNLFRSTLAGASLAALALVAAGPGGLWAQLVIAPAPGYSITWNGNDGAFFNPAAIAPAPSNLALATMGSTPFADGQLAVGPHFTPTLNDGLYGNSNSWISDAAAPNFAGVTLAVSPMAAVTSVAWGRDNGNNVTDACGGQCTDRSLGTYSIYRTTVAGANAATPVTGSAASGWELMGTLNYVGNLDGVVGGLFTSYFRHEYDVLLNGQPVPMTAFRIDVPFGGITNGTAIDEIEVFGTAVPEPASAALWGLLGAIGLLATLRGLKLRRQQ